MNQRNQIAIVVLLSVPSFLFIPQGLDAASSPSVSAPDAAYVQSYEKWKAELTDDLKQNWVPLAGLYWLKPGANSFGADPANAVVFPKGPAHAGEFDLEGKDVTMKVVADAHATVAGKP